MKNTLALAIVLFGGILIYSGYQNWTIADTIRFFAGQKMVNPPKPSGGGGGGAVPDPKLTDPNNTIEPINPERPTGPTGPDPSGGKLTPTSPPGGNRTGGL